MNMEQKFCQSCGMPMTTEIYGTNADGSVSLSVSEASSLKPVDLR